MTTYVLLFACASIAVACGTPAVNKSGSSAKTNVNAVNSMAYSQMENTYSLAQADVDIYPLKESVGRTASEMNLWQNKNVVRRLRNLMGANFATMVKFWNTETPLKKFGDVLMLTGCERDNCSGNRYVIFLSTSEGLLSVVHIGKDTIREWKTRDTLDLPLPTPFAEELTVMKSRRKEENGN